MKRKFMFTYIFIIITLSAIVGYISISSSQKHLENQIKSSSETDLDLLSEILVGQYSSLNMNEFVNRYCQITGFRITLIDLNGEVIADSSDSIQEFENHSYREEFKDALEYGTGFSTRYSSTMNSFYVYYSKKIEFESQNIVIRISNPLLEIQQLKSEILNSSMNGIAFGIAVAIFISFLFSKWFLNPVKELIDSVDEMSNGNYDRKVYIESNDEFGKLAKAFNSMSRELKYTMMELKDKNIKLESILNSMKNGIIAIDMNSNIIMSNCLSCKLLDIDIAYIVGRPFYEIIRNRNIFEIIEKSLNYSEQIVKEINYNNSCEKILRISSNSIISEDSKKSRGIVLVIEDITQIRKLENMRSDFVSNVTHELKTPLTSIKGFVDTLKDGAVENLNTAQRFLDIISIEVERLYNLIQEILSLSEIESKDRDTNISKVSIYDILDTVQKILCPLASQKGIELQFSVESEILNLMCNRQRITQMIINIVDNAIKYTEVGNVYVEFKNESNCLNILVKDTGIGIPKKNLDRIFERFYRVDKGRSRKIGGTGLGLSIVKHIVILYKGSIEVKSELGKGTVFKIELPILSKYG